jgi:hypothetical protein
MAARLPVYKLVIYAPRREDPTETTVLTPIGGAVHSDPFQVATKKGISGFAGYLGLPRGRRGKVDFLSRKVDIGELTLPLLDKRTTAGGSNLERWVSAFIGDEHGRNRLLGCKAKVWESLDGGSSWSSFFAGRVKQHPTKGALWYELTLRDMAQDLDIDVFTGVPHSSVTYASMSPLLPNGNILPYANFATTARLRGRIGSQGSSAPGLRIVTLDDQKKYPNGPENWVTRRVWDAEHVPPMASDAGGQVHPTALVHLKRLDTSAEGIFRLRFLGGTIDTDDILTNVQAADDAYRRYFDRVKYHPHWRVSKIGLEQLGGSETGYMAMPPDGTRVEFHLVDDAPPGDSSPLLISDAHPAQLWADMLDGYFGRLNDDGTPLLPVARDTSAFNTLIADSTIPPARFVITELARLNAWIEEFICKPYGLAYRVDADGQVVPIDLRLPSSAPVVPTITRADLLAGQAPTWDPDWEGSVTRVEITHYIDDEVTAGAAKESSDEYPDVPGARITSRDTLYIPVDLAAEAELGEKTYTIDGRGYRSARGETAEMMDRLNWIQAHLAKVAQQVRGPFGWGPTTATLQCRRTSNTGCYPGELRYVDVDLLPNPAANRRGGTRLCRCLERTEDGIGVTLSFLDAGPGTVAVVPSIGTPTQNADQTSAAADVAVTLNASGEPAEVEIALTSTSTAVRPAATSTAWTPAGRVYSSGSLTAGALPPGVRVWVRARTIAHDGAQWKLPSAWVFPSGTGYVDLGAFPAFDAFTLSLSADGTGTVAFTPNASALGARVYYATARAGTATPTFTDFVDVDAADGEVDIPTTVLPGAELWVYAEPWTGWTGSAVSGTTGRPVTLSEARAADAGTFAVKVELISEDATTETYAITPGAGVEQVWGAQVDFVAPLPATPWDTVMAASAFLAFGATTLIVTKPAYGHVALVQVEPRYLDEDTLAWKEGPVVRFRVFPQPAEAPQVQVDALETGTDVTLWLRLQEFGLATSNVQFRSNLEDAGWDAWVSATRTSGGASTVKGGTLGALEYEYDQSLAARGFTKLQYRYTISTGEVITSDPISFNRDSVPTLISVTIDGTRATIIADFNDTLSVALEARGALAPWRRIVDGCAATWDVAVADADANPGLGAATEIYRAFAYAKPKSQVGVGTLYDWLDVAVTGSGGATEPAWTSNTLARRPQLAPTT